MKGTLTVIRPGGRGLVHEPLEAAPQPEQIQAALDGGPIEQVPYFAKYMGEDCVAFCDEEGKIKQLPFNAGATALWACNWGGRPGTDYLCGPVVIVSGDRELLDAM